MTCRKWLVSLGVLVVLSAFTGLVQAAPIPGSAGMITLQDGPNAEGLDFTINVHYEAFDGQDAGDPLGLSAEKQYAYILEYVSGNEKLRFFTVDSTNGVPILPPTTSLQATAVNGVLPGTAAPAVSLPINGNLGARWVYPGGFLGAGTKSVILVYKAAANFDVGTVLAVATDTSLSSAGEVVGPTECFGVIEGIVFCLDCGQCGPTGGIVPMEGATVTVSADGNEVATAVTNENGGYQFSGLNTGTYTVTASGDGLDSCSQNSKQVTVVCDAGALALFCLCPTACTQSICIRTVCDGNAVPAWVGIDGPQVQQWGSTGAGGVKCFDGMNIVPGHYKVNVEAPTGYEVVGNSVAEFDLAECEDKEVVFEVCPIPPCEQTVCIKVAEDVDGNEVPVAAVAVKLKKNDDIKTGTTDAAGEACFDNVEVGSYVAIIDVPEGYRLCDGASSIPFGLERCEHEDVNFVLCKVTLGPCPLSPGYWKNHPESWPVDATPMWIGADELDQAALLNVLSNMKVDGSSAKSSDMSVKLAKFLIATKLNLAMGADPKDIEAVVIAADEFLLYDYPPGSNPKGKGKELARQLKNTLEEYVLDNSYCNPVEP